MDERQAGALRRWIDSLSPDATQRYFLLLAELCRGLDVSKHEQFGFLRLRAEFETSGEIFGCSLEELRDALARVVPESVRHGARAAPSPLEVLRAEVGSKGHPDFR